MSNFYSVHTDVKLANFRQRTCIEMKKKMEVGTGTLRALFLPETIAICLNLLMEVLYSTVRLGEQTKHRNICL